MNLTLNSVECMLRDSAAGFFSQRCPPAKLRQLRDNKDAQGYDQQLWQEAAKMGYAGLFAPETCGGVDLGFVAAGQVAEQIGRQLSPCPFLSTAVLASLALRHGDGSTRHTGLLSAIASGERIVTLAVDESARHAPDRINTTWQNGRLSGYKRMVLDAHVADELLVAARIGDTVGLVRVASDAPGVHIQRSGIVDAHNMGHVRFDDVAVGEMAVIHDPTALSSALLGGRALISAMQLGAARQVFDMTIEYLQQRQQFGHIIGSFQGLQHRAGHLYSELEAATSANLAALSALDNADDHAELYVVMAKIKVSQTASLAANEAVQMHGGMGMTDALDVGLYMKRCRVLSALLGDRHWLLDQAATLQGY
ncbi:MAG: alkylation response protein AidB-like acyl-CoA dehydrogenase [Bermanella sp.]|jgi:alkylation response protein AidB-like acyl-CoA dehydrogenase